MSEYQYLTTCGRSAAAENRNSAREAVRNQDNVLLKCSSIGTLTIPINTEAGTSYNLVNLNLDTSEFRKPCVKLDFLSNILTNAASITLNFQVFRQCKNQFAPIAVGPVWTFSRVADTIEEANSFVFAVCDCDQCDCGCCNYSVVATIAGTTPTGGTTTINNASLIATVVETADC